MSDEVTFNGLWYTVGGWSFDEDDKNLAYIEEALNAWSKWRDYVKAEQDAS